jgi:RNA polymerase sigma-70 factor, ECF subfamily
MRLPDDVLIDRIARDRLAMQLLYGRHARARLVRDEQVAEDLISEVF